MQAASGGVNAARHRLPEVTSRWQKLVWASNPNAKAPETNIFIADWIPWREILRNVPSLLPEREGGLISLFPGGQTK